MIFDTHAHYDSSQFKDDRDAVLTALPESGVGLAVSRNAFPISGPPWGCIPLTAAGRL